MTSPTHSSSASTTAVLHQHLVQSALLNSSCHDVTLSCFSRHYRVHRIFLIQSSFFSALLQGQYAEGLNYTVPGNAAGPSGAASSSSGGGQVLELHFDDPNITRPAFEYCLARLYGSAPQLQLPSWALPTNSQPLSPNWPPASSSSPTPGETSRPITSTNDLPPLGEGFSMPATPRFLLSLLATSLYLGIPSLTSSTLTLIMASFTPYTVPTYLSFALGKPILGAREARLREEDHDRSWWDWELEGPCWGLEGVGKLVASSSDEEEKEDFQSYDPKQESTTPPTEEYFDEAEDHKPTRSSSMQGQGATAEFVQAKASRDSTPQAIPPRPTSLAPPLLDYGATAHRIAESIFCYLARWGVDLVDSEEDKWQQDVDLLDDWIDEALQSRDGSSSGRQHDSILVNENLAPYILPRGYVPAQAGPTTDGTPSPESSTAFPAKWQWHMPRPPLTIFSHPSSALRILSRSGFVFTVAASSVKVTPRLDGEDFAQTIEVEDDTAGLGLHSAQLADILSSDAFFVRNELERYTLSSKIVEMRRAQQSLQQELAAVRTSPGRAGSSSFLSSTKDETYQSQGSDLSRLRLDTPDNSMMDVDDSFRAANANDFEVVDEDDVHYARLFKDGIYYSHLGFNDLNRISDEAVAAAAAARSAASSASQATTSRSSSISSDDEGLSDVEASKQRSFLPTRKSKPQIAAPIEVLQAALWAGHEFENRIRAASSSFDRAANNTDSPRSFEAIQRGRAFSAEGSELPQNPGAFETVAPNADVEEFAATATTAARQKEAKEQSEATLGVASDLTSFEAVGNAAQASTSTTTLPFSSPRRSHRLAGRASRSVTPASPVNAAILQGSAAESSSLLPRTGSTTSKANLSKRYFAVPQDDTVRFGEYFSGLISNPPWSVNAAATSTAGLPTGYSAFEHEATGVAAMKDPYSLPPLVASSFMPNRRARNSTLSKDSPHCIRHLDKLSLKGGPLSDVKRAKDNLFGLKNRECTGRTLSKVGADVARQTAALERQGIVIRATVTNAKDGLPSKSAVQEEAANETTVSVGDTAVLGTSPSNETSSNPSSALAFQLAHLSSRTWTPHEPIRVGIEYFSISKLEERSRLYSPSFWYAGSVWNLYVQIIKKPKAKQLGIFLHRQSPHEPLPNASASEEEVRAYHMQRRTSDSNKAGAFSSASTAGHPYPCASLSFLPSPTNGSSSPTMAGRSVESQLQRENPHHNNTAPLDSPSSHHFVLPPGPPTLPGTCPPIPYRDNRKLVKAYFSIHCHSPLGPSLTRFDSGPDLWKESQSWGWKSSSLLTSFWLEGGVLEGGKGEGTDNVRCTVVMGVV